jgi:hypothetical protein
MVTSRERNTSFADNLRVFKTPPTTYHFVIYRSKRLVVRNRETILVGRTGLI